MDHLEMGYTPFKHWGFFYLCSCDSGVPTQACGMLGSHWTVPCCWPYPLPQHSVEKRTLSKFVVILWSFILSSPPLCLWGWVVAWGCIPGGSTSHGSHPYRHDCLFTVMLCSVTLFGLESSLSITQWALLLQHDSRFLPSLGLFSTPSVSPSWFLFPVRNMFTPLLSVFVISLPPGLHCLPRKWPCSVLYLGLYSQETGRAFLLLSPI